MQPNRSFFARGGTLVVLGVVLALISVVISLVPALGGPDPFTLIAGEKVTFQLKEIGIGIGIAYFLLVVALVGVGVYRLMESAPTGDSGKPDPTGTGMHPAT